MFDTYEANVHIIDLVHMPNRFTLRQHFYKFLCSSFAVSTSKFFECWIVDGPTEWELQYHQLCPPDIPRFFLFFSFHISCTSFKLTLFLHWVFISFLTNLISGSYYSGVAMLVMSRHFNGHALDVEITKVLFLTFTAYKIEYHIIVHCILTLVS